MSVTPLVPHDQWPSLVREGEFLTLPGRTPPITVYAFHAPSYRWIGVVRHASEIVDAATDAWWGGVLNDTFANPNTTVYVNGYDLTDLACQMRDALEEHYRIQTPTIRIRVWSHVEGETE